MAETQYLALLRGINVGGSNIIKMADLKMCFENMGFTYVTTYIQSGNVLFKSAEKDKTKLINKIEKVLSKRFSYKSRIVAVTHRELKKIIEGAQRGFGKDVDKYRSVEQIVICSPDKDLAQLVSGKHIVCWDRRREIILDEKGVVEKFGVSPQSIPDWLALVGDSADGYPGIPGWGAKSTSAVLSKFKHIESIPDDAGKWRLKSISPGRASSLTENLLQRREEALLYRQLSTLRTDVPIKEKLSDLKWQGAWGRLKKVCQKLGDERISERIPRWR